MPRKKRTPEGSQGSVGEASPIVPLPLHLLSVDQVAASLSVSRSTVYHLMNQQGLPYTMVGGNRRVRLESLQWWITQQECSTDPEMQAYLDRRKSTVNPAPVETMEKLATRRATRKTSK